MVSHPELSSDPSIGSDRESGCDTYTHTEILDISTGLLHPLRNSGCDFGRYFCITCIRILNFNICFVLSDVQLFNP